VSTRREADFVASLVDEDIRAPLPGEWPRMAELMRQYADFPLGAADASIVALAERLDTDVIITLDRRHFSAIRPRHCEHFRLLPE
jgi:predicted nucleic acid-binding protein